MRLISLGEPGEERAGIALDDFVLDLSVIRPSWPRTWRALLQAGLALNGEGFPSLELHAVIAEARRAFESSRMSSLPLLRPLSSVRLGPPIPDPSKILAVGLNYRDHALEQKKEPPTAPLLFAKAPTCLIGANDPIRLPDPSIEDQVDAEAELCVVLGRRARDLAEDEALGAVLGFTVMNDVSGRRAQYGDKQWFRGKSFDTFGPCGPWIVTREELPDPSNLSLEADWGERAMQRGNTRDLIFSVPALLAYASRMMTLLPGDLLTTGTPAGVGMFREPQVFLRRGEAVTIRLEGVGELRNSVE